MDRKCPRGGSAKTGLRAWTLEKRRLGRGKANKCFAFYYLYQWGSAQSFNFSAQSFNFFAQSFYFLAQSFN